jgi:polyisoprenoid-binding protein YceI
LLWNGIGVAEEWHLDREADNLVKFTSRVAALTFDGTTNQIDGYVYGKSNRVFERNTQMHFEIDLNALDTGIGKRDRDMRQILETDKFRFATFEGTISDFVILNSSTPACRVIVTGTVVIHGIKKDLKATGTVIIKDGKMHVKSDFRIRLADFEIEAQSLMAFVKVSEEIIISLDFYLNKVIE